MKKMLCLFTLSSCLVLSACTTSRGLAPVSKFFNETNGKTYRDFLDKSNLENSNDLKNEFDKNKKSVEDIRSKKYPPLSFLWGSSLEKDLVPVDEFLGDDTGKKFIYKQWVENEYANNKIIESQKTTRLNELASIKDLVHYLATGK